MYQRHTDTGFGRHRSVYTLNLSVIIQISAHTVYRKNAVICRIVVNLHRFVRC